MRRIAFRRVLPIIQLALFAALLVAANEAVRAARAERELAYRSGEWHFPLEHTRFPPLEVCFAINYPAGALAVIIFAVVMDHHSTAIPPELDLRFVLYWGFAVVFQWYLIGLWVDRRLGSVLTPQRHPNVLVKTITWVIFVVTFVVSGLSFYVILVHEPGRLMFQNMSKAAWVAFSAIVSGLSIRRWRKLAQS